MAMDPFSQLILIISVTSFLTFQWLFHKVSPWMSMRISPGFLGLSDKQKVEWNSRTVSTFHALLVGIFCLYILFFDDPVNEDPVCWFFEVLGYPKSSRPNMANGVAMAVVFFMVRIAVMPVYYGRMYAVYGTEAFYLVPWGGRVAWICSSICLDIMNIMWMHKIARGCYKVLRSAHWSKAATPQENGKTD